MSIKILSSTEFMKSEERKKYFTIGIKSGRNHTAEMVASSLLSLFYQDKKIAIVMTQNSEEQKKCNYSIDIGEEEIHVFQKQLKSRTSEIPYGYCGIMWNAFGRQIIYKMARNLSAQGVFRGSMKEAEIAKVFQAVDTDIIALVDCEEMKIKTEKYCLSFVSEIFSQCPEGGRLPDEQYLRTLNRTITILEEKIRAEIYRS